MKQIGWLQRRAQGQAAAPSKWQPAAHQTLVAGVAAERPAACRPSGRRGAHDLRGSCGGRPKEQRQAAAAAASGGGGAEGKPALVATAPRSHQRLARVHGRSKAAAAAAAPSWPLAAATRSVGVTDRSGTVSDTPSSAARNGEGQVEAQGARSGRTRCSVACLSGLAVHCRSGLASSDHRGCQGRSDRSIERCQLGRAISPSPCPATRIVAPIATHGACTSSSRHPASGGARCALPAGQASHSCAPAGRQAPPPRAAPVPSPCSSHGAGRGADGLAGGGGSGRRQAGGGAQRCWPRLRPPRQGGRAAVCGACGGLDHCRNGGAE